MKRFLLSTTRSVVDASAYLDAWERLCKVVVERGGHAWIFTAADRPAEFLEFIEWKQAGGTAPMPDDGAVRAAREDLDRFGMANQQLWKEVSKR